MTRITITVLDQNGKIVRDLGPDEQIRIEAFMGGGFAVGSTVQEGQSVQLFVDGQPGGIYRVIADPTDPDSHPDSHRPRPLHQTESD